MPKRTRSYNDSLLEDLRDPEQAAAYLAASLEEPADDPESETLFLMALKNIAIAHGMTGLARRANLSRESLYKALSKQGDPKHSTLRAVLDAVGLRFTVHSATKARAPQNILVHTWENVISCDAEEWQTDAETKACLVHGIPRPALPRRSKADPSSQVDWNSKEEFWQERIAFFADGGIGS